MPSLPQLDWFGLILVPLAIFLARIVDQSIGTLRITFISRGMALPAVAAGFCESLIWILAVSQIMSHLTMPHYYVAYAGGFAMGNYVGLRIERRLAMGKVVLRLITHRPVEEVVAVLKSGGLGATVMDAEGQQGAVHVILSVLPRRDLAAVLKRIEQVHPKAFYTVESVAQVEEGVFPEARLRRASLLERQRK